MTRRNVLASETKDKLTDIKLVLTENLTDKFRFSWESFDIYFFVIKHIIFRLSTAP